MALDIFFKEDVAQMLQGHLVVAVEGMQHGHGNYEYLAGVLTATKAMSLSIGVPWTRLLVGVRDALGSDVAEMLEPATRLIE